MTRRRSDWAKQDWEKAIRAPQARLGALAGFNCWLCQTCGETGPGELFDPENCGVIDRCPTCGSKRIDVF